MIRPLFALSAALLVAAPGLPQPAAKKAAADATEYLRVIHDRTGRFGLTVVAGKESGKRITFSPDGATNNTAVSVNGTTFVLNATPPTVPTAVATDEDGKVWTTGWELPARKLAVTQEIRLVRGEETGKLDAVYVRYRLANKAADKQKLGLRFMLDTLIGSNDGVPFLLPETTELVTATATAMAEDKTLPEYVLAFENPDFRNPGTVARVGLRPPSRFGPVEHPDKMLISHWPGSGAAWDYPVTPAANDSAVGLYWLEDDVDPGAERRLGFTYGLAKVATGKSGGKLGLIAGGAAEVGKTITVVGFTDPRLKQPAVTLTLPAGLRLAAGEKARQVPAVRPGDPYGRVSWKVVCDRPGEFVVRAALADGAREELTVAVR